jgi:hypothetical protein
MSETDGKPPDVRNRIKKIRKMRLGDIAHNPMNWRGHPQEQRQAFRGIMKEIGWAGMPLVYQSERTGTLTYIDGHMRKEELPDMEAEVAITDLSDAEADMLLVTYDPIAELAKTDTKLLETLLRNVSTTDASMMEFISRMAEQEGIIPPDFQPVSIDEQGRLDQRSPIECPECGATFIPKV